MCGKRYPTFALKACRLGFNEVETSLLSSSSAAAELGYPMRARWGVRLCLLVYIIIVLSFVCVGQLRGNLAITTSMLVRTRVFSMKQSWFERVSTLLSAAASVCCIVG
jgi:hypothetical protein